MSRCLGICSEIYIFHVGISYNKKYVLWNVYLPNATNSKSKHVRFPYRLNIAKRYTYFMCKFPIFEILEVKQW